MAAASWLKYAYCAHFSKPKTDRQLYRMVKRHRICRIIELGIVDLLRSSRMIEIAQRFSGDAKIQYTGLDWFDTRPTVFPDLRLKHTHQRLQPTGAAVRLVPGSPGASLPAVANAHQNTDLILISHLVEEVDLEPAWFYMPRMLHAKSFVLRERRDTDGVRTFCPLSVEELSQRAVRTPKRRAA